MKHLLEIPCLDDRAFTPIGGRMRLYGKSDAPAAPDYVSLANTTAQGNADLARQQTSANRINQTTPYGSINYTNDRTLDWDAWNASVNKYNAEMENWQAHGSVPGQAPAAPDQQSFMRDNWSSNIQLSPAQQEQLDSMGRQTRKLGYAGEDLSNQAHAAMNKPLDISDIPSLKYDVDPATGMAAWDRATDLIRQRQNPELDRQQAALDTKLANMGMTAGSEGWRTQQQQFGKTRNDADMAAQLAGLQAQDQFFGQALSNAGLRNQARQQGINERVDLRNLPLKELQALRSVSGITNPTFYTPGQQGQTSGADLTGAGQSQYNAGLSAVNAQNQQAANTAGAGVGLLAAAASFY